MSDPVENITNATDEEPGFLLSVFQEIFYSPLNLLLVAIIAILVYKIIKGRIDVPHSHQKPEEPPLPKLRRDFTIQELRKFDGNQEDGRVLVGVNGTVYDVTKGTKFYGPGGPYASFAGRDASRNLATFNVVANDKDEYDDLSDLNAMEMDSVREWEMQFKEKYDVVGRLLRPGEQPTNYSDEDEDTAAETKTDENELRKRVTAATAASKSDNETEAKATSAAEIVE